MDNFKSYMFLILFSAIGSSVSMNTNTESLLRQDLFNEYDTNVRPVFNQTDNVKMEIGVEIRSLESFNQVSETIDIT